MAAPIDPLLLLLTELRKVDTLHDFEGDRGGLNIKAQLDPVYGADGMDRFIAELNTGYRDKYKQNGNYKYKNISLSGIENENTESIFAQLLRLENNTDNDASVTIEDIVSKYGVAENAQTVLNDVCGFNSQDEVHKLKLFIPDNYRKPFFKNADNKSKINFLADVMMHFFFGGVVAENETQRILFSVDANPGDFACIFSGIDRARTLADAAILGDSATGGIIDHSTDKPSVKDEMCMNLPTYKIYFNKKSGGIGDKNFPLPYTDEQQQYYAFDSNEFTRDFLSLRYSRKPQPPPQPDVITSYAQFINDIQFEVYLKPDILIGSSHFGLFEGLTVTSGDSVATLKKLIMVLNDNNPPAAVTDAQLTSLRKSLNAVYDDKTASSTLKLTNIIIRMLNPTPPNRALTIPEIIKFLLDYKRGGDYEQVNSAAIFNSDNPAYSTSNIVVLTGDRLCSLYARAKHQPCAFIHHFPGKGFIYDMYSFAKPAQVTPEQKRINEKKKKLKNILINLQKINAVSYDNLASFANSIRMFKDTLSGTPISSLLTANISGLLVKMDSILGRIPEIKTAVGELIKGVNETLNKNDEVFNEAFSTQETLYEQFENNNDYKEAIAFFKNYDLNDYNENKLIKQLKTNKFDSLSLNLSLSLYEELVQFINSWRRFIVEWNKMYIIPEIDPLSQTRASRSQVSQLAIKNMFLTAQLPNFLNRFNPEFALFKDNLMSFFLDMIANNYDYVGVISTEQRKWNYPDMPIEPNYTDLIAQIKVSEQPSLVLRDLSISLQDATKAALDALAAADQAAADQAASDATKDALIAASNALMEQKIKNITVWRQLLKQLFIDNDPNITTSSSKDDFEQMWAKVEKSLKDMSMTMTAFVNNPVGGVRMKRKANADADAAEEEHDEAEAVEEPPSKKQAFNNPQITFTNMLVCEMDSIKEKLGSANVSKLYEIIGYIKGYYTDIPDCLYKIDEIDEMNDEATDTFIPIIDERFIDYFETYFFTERIGIIKTMLGNKQVSLSEKIAEKIGEDYDYFNSGGGAESLLEYRNRVYSDFFKMFDEVCNQFEDVVLNNINDDGTVSAVVVEPVAVEPVAVEPVAVEPVAVEPELGVEPSDETTIHSSAEEGVMQMQMQEEAPSPPRFSPGSPGDSGNETGDELSQELYLSSQEPPPSGGGKISKLTNIICNSNRFELRYYINQKLNEFLMSTIQQTLIISQAEEYVYSNTPEIFITKFLTYCFSENSRWKEENALNTTPDVTMQAVESPAVEGQAEVVATTGPIRRVRERVGPYSRPTPTPTPNPTPNPNLGGNLTKKHKSKLHCKTKHKYVKLNKLNKHKNTKKQNIKIKKYTRKH